MFRTQRHNKLLVRFLFAILVEHAHMRLSSIERLASFAQAAGQSVVDECEFKYALQSLDDTHLSLGGGAVGGDFDLVGRCDGGAGLFSVRLPVALADEVQSQSKGRTWSLPSWLIF